MIEPGKKTKRQRFRNVSLYVELSLEGEPEAVAAAIRRFGGEVWEIDGDVDLEHWPRGGIAHTAVVFRLRLDRERPVYELLSAVAELPDVYSASVM